MEAIQDIFQSQITAIAKKKGRREQLGHSKHLGWVFMCGDRKDKHTAVRSYGTFFKYVPESIFYTPNTFYRNDHRSQDTLRWLNTIVIDIDVKNGQNEHLSLIIKNGHSPLMDILDAIEEAGLPTPSLIVSTPSGGFHIYFHLVQPMRATAKAIKLYKDIQSQIAFAIGGDLQAIGPERWWRIPTQDNIIFSSGQKTSAGELLDWLEIKREDEKCKSVFINRVSKGSLLKHPAILTILDGVEEGKRDNAAFTLALTYKAEGYEEDEALDRLIDWNEKLEKRLPQKQIRAKVKSAYKNKYKGPSAASIREVSGMYFSYKPFEGAKDRNVRTYSHFEEWENDLLTQLEQGSLEGAQRKIADQLGIPYSTFKIILKRLSEANKIIVEVTGRGRSASTLIILVTTKNDNIIQFTVTSFSKKNGLDSNTLMVTVVGGRSFRVLRVFSKDSLSPLDG